MRFAPTLSVAAALLRRSKLGCRRSTAATYREGPVTNVSYIRIKPGMFDKYMKYLATDYKRNMEAQKKAGIILDYAVYSSPQTHDGDWNMLLTTTFKEYGRA